MLTFAMGVFVGVMLAAIFASWLQHESQPAPRDLPFWDDPPEVPKP